MTDPHWLKALDFQLKDYIHPNHQPLTPAQYEVVKSLMDMAYWEGFYAGAKSMQEESL